MKQKFSTSWKASSKPRKQRKYLANAPLHIKKKFISVNLAKPLRSKEGKRNVQVKKDDKVKVMRGKFKGTQGKVLSVSLKYGKVYMEGVQVTKMDNSKANVPLKPSNLQIIEIAERKGKSKTHKNTEGKKTETPKKDLKEDKVVSETKSENKENKK
jgi:large subunit ribosomal protein L24